MAKKILIVDDEADLIFMIKAVLEKDGYEVVSATDGNAALKLLKTVVPDLMIVDLTMPMMSGWQLNMKVRQDSRFKNTPIIVLSGLIEQDSTPEKFELASAYMVKPFDVFKLLEKVTELLK